MLQSTGGWPPGSGGMARLVREHGWAATPLGPPEGWPESLKALVGTMLQVPQAMWIGWGPELVQIYNDSYRSLLDAERHGAALGRPTRETWADTWSVVEPLLTSILAGGPAVFQADRRELYRHEGALRERWFSYSFSPVPDERAPSGVGGVLCVAVETTPAVLLRQRQERDRFLLALSDALRPLAEPAAIQGEATRLLRERFDVGWCTYLEFNVRLEEDRDKTLDTLRRVQEGEHVLHSFRIRRADGSVR